MGGCGFGNKTRAVYCWNKIREEIRVDDTHCRKLLKPLDQQPCVDSSCGYGWYASSWSSVSINKHLFILLSNLNAIDNLSCHLVL